MRPARQQFEFMKTLGFGERQIIRFRDEFYYSGKSSVDAFLEHRPDFLDVGKAAIATILIPLESPENLFSFEKNWLRYVFANLNAKVDEFKGNKLSIITYNYDRTVEHFFFTALKHTYRKNDNDCIKMMEHVPIVHLHGRLGYLPWQNDRSRSYSTELDPREVKLAAESIKIIHEDITDGRDEDFKKAKELLKLAENAGTDILSAEFFAGVSKVYKLPIPPMGSPPHKHHTLTIATRGYPRSLN
jgi:hypothetical protein